MVAAQVTTAGAGVFRFFGGNTNSWSLRIDGHHFGRVDASEPDESYQRIDLLPNELAFFPPWDGTYDT